MAITTSYSKGSRRGASDPSNRQRSATTKIKATLNLQSVAPSPAPSAAEILRREMEARSNKSLIWGEEDFVRVDRRTSRRGRVR